MRRRPVRVLSLERIPGHRGARLLADQLDHATIVGGRDHQPRRGHAPHELCERGEVAGLVWIDVDVVVLDRRDDRHLGAVVPELGRLLEKRRVVFVTLDHERRRAPRRVRGGEHRQSPRRAAGRQAKALVEVHRQPADQEAGVAPGRVEQPRAQRAGGRLAVRARDHQRRGVAEDVIGERLRHAGHRDARLERGARLDVARPTHVADHHQIRTWLEVRGIEAAQQPDAPALERRPHRRVERHVGAGHVVPRLLEEPGERAHPGARDRDEVNAHRRRICDRRLPETSTERSRAAAGRRSWRCARARADSLGARAPSTRLRASG